MERGRVNYRGYENTRTFLEKVNDALYAVLVRSNQYKKVAMRRTVIVLSFNDTDATQRLLLTLLPFPAAFFCLIQYQWHLRCSRLFSAVDVGRFGFALPSDENISAKLSNFRSSDPSMPGLYGSKHFYAVINFL